LSAALALNCSACAEYYLQLAKKENVSRDEISEITAKVMAVSAGQKRVQANRVMEKY
jgi:alkylhydroperoxidase/carboxymuconolactone decarboxylase family protein YurZ